MAICHKCGISHQGLGLCPTCTAVRTKERTIQAENFVRERHISVILPENKLMLVVYALVPIVILYALWEKIFPTPAILNSANGYFIVSNEDKSTVINYEYEESANISGYVLDYVMMGSSVAEGGMVVQLGYLDEAAYAAFKQQFGNSRQCPAGFYNANIKHLFILASNDRCRTSIQSQDFSDWGKINFNGKYAKWAEGHDKRGPLSIASGNYRFFVVENCA